MTIFQTPQPDLEDHPVIEAIHAMRSDLSGHLRVPRRWTGTLRRSSKARAIQSSNSIEGYDITDQDALAAVDDEEPLTADERTWAEITGYRRALTYVLQMAVDPDFRLDAQTLRSLHFMLLEHDPGKTPGRYRTGQVFVYDEARGKVAYEGPDADQVPGLVEELVQTSSDVAGVDPLVRAAMAHLNLVMIHPFRDGNGRMARVLQTLMLAQDTILEPTFSSIEEWLGHNTDDYYRALAYTGQGSWRPENDASLWVKFNLRAHHMQAQTLQRRFAEADVQWRRIDELVETHRLPERVGDALFDVLIGARVRRPSYMTRADVEGRTATRDLLRLSELGLLDPVGKARGRYYVAGPALREISADLERTRQPLTDPYPWLKSALVSATR